MGQRSSSASSGLTLSAVLGGSCAKILVGQGPFIFTPPPLGVLTGLQIFTHTGTQVGIDSDLQLR
jgi:hypothetical protein